MHYLLQLLCKTPCIWIDVLKMAFGHQHSLVNQKIYVTARKRSCWATSVTKADLVPDSFFVNFIIFHKIYQIGR